MPKSEGGRGHLDATTDPDQIRRWWHRWPDANIAIATGERSGLLVLDVDAAGGFTSLAALEAEHGPLPPTLMVATGGSGRHVYLRYPTGCGIRNSAGNVGRGLDVRGEGGYVVAPPSRTDKGRYTVLDEIPIAEPPAWLLEAARGAHGAVRTSRDEDVAGAVRITNLGDREPIQEGRRNDELTRIAGALRARGLELEELEAEIQAVNATRCSPSLEAAEVAGIARSVCRYPAGDACPDPPPEILETVEALFSEVLNRLHWTGRSGPTDRAVYAALLITARRYGQPSRGGVKVYIAVRDLAKAAGTSRPTVMKALDRLRARALVYRASGGRGAKAGALVLRTTQGFTTLPVGGVSTDSGQPLSNVMRELLRLRWGPGRVGKLRALLLEVIASTGGATLLEISERTGRRRHNVRRALRLLEARALVECSEETYRLVPEFAAALDAELEASGVKLSERLDEQRYRRQQQAFRAAWEAGAVTKSRHRRFFREWESRNPKLEADGFIEELERVEADHDHDHDLVEDRAPTPQPTDSVITDASDPEQLRQLAALARERIAEHRRKHPPAKLPAPERAARLLRRLRDEDPNLLAALSADPRRLGREPWRRGWTEAVFPANTMTRALGLLEAEALAAEVGERVVA